MYYKDPKLCRRAYLALRPFGTLFAGLLNLEAGSVHGRPLRLCCIRMLSVEHRRVMAFLSFIMLSLLRTEDDNSRPIEPRGPEPDYMRLQGALFRLF